MLRASAAADVTNPLFGTQPLQLVTISDDGKLAVVPETLARIRDIDNPNGIGALVVAGPYHKGKSYLLNQIAGTRPPDSGFTVGLHTEAETKGLWVLARQMRGLTVLLVDSEGVDAPGNRATADSRVFALCLLLSSVFVYNTTGLIEENSLRHLSFVVSLAEHISPGAERHASVTMPHLMWLVRDFQYWNDLERRHEGSASAYMESVLSRGMSDADGGGGGGGGDGDDKAKAKAKAAAADGGGDENVRIREGLSKIFPRKSRSCYLLAAPAYDTEQLVSTPDDQLNPRFVSGLATLVHDALPRVMTAKRQGARVLQGPGYARVVELCVSAMNESVEEVTLFIPNIRAKFAATEAEDVYDRGMEFEAKRFPLDDDALDAAHAARRKAAIGVYDAKAYGPSKERVGAELAERLDAKLTRFRARNSSVRDTAFLGFGNLQTAAAAGALLFIVLALGDISTSLVVLGALVLSYYLGYFYVFTNRLAAAIDTALTLWERHGRAWADAHPQAMAAAVFAVVLLLWWFVV